VTKDEKFRHVHSHCIEPGSHEDAHAGSEDDYVQRENGLSVADASVDPSHAVHGSNLSPPTVLQFGKSRKLSVERPDPRKSTTPAKTSVFPFPQGTANGNGTSLLGS